MNTETSFSECFQTSDVSHKASIQPGIWSRFRAAVELSDWEERMLSYERWLNWGCIAVIVVAVCYFFPVAVGILGK